VRAKAEGYRSTQSVLVSESSFGYGAAIDGLLEVCIILQARVEIVIERLKGKDCWQLE
jgi:hypothetical protein